MPLARAVPLALLLVSALLRVHNAWVASPLSGYDGPYHAAYIGILHFEGRFPLQDESWSTFHPPFYYALCAAVWELLPDAWGPHAVLFALRLVNVAFSLALGWAVYRSARLLFPERPRLPTYALAIVLFLPMHVGPSVQIGNEMAATSLGGLALLLLWLCLAKPEDRRRPLALGAVLALALLSKFSVGVIALTALAALAAQGVTRAGWRLAALRNAALAGGVLLLLTAPYFGRNLVHFGVPSLVHVDVSADVMREAGFGRPRPWRDYVRLHADVLRDPGSRHPRITSSVWPVTFATTWFDIHHTVIDHTSPWSRRLAPLLFAFGAILTGFALLGIVALWRGSPRAAVPFATPALTLLTLLALLAFVAFTRRVANFSVLKGIYLDPAVVPVCLFAAVGLDRAAERAALVRHAVHGALASFVALVTALFWMGGLSPMALEPAGFYLQVYSDPPTRRTFEYFLKRPAPEPRPRRPPSVRRR